VARFACAPIGRLWLVQLIVAIAAGGTLVWFIATAWEPSIREGIRRLPNQGGVRGGQLEWPDVGNTRLAEGRFLTWMATPGVESNPGQVSDLQVEFGDAAVKVRSFFGFVALPYPRGWSIEVNRTALEPWWGAWRPAVYAAVFGGGVVGLFVAWWVLAFLYAFPARLMAALGGRSATWWQCWKLCGAALMPGALIFTLAIGLYGLQRLSLPTLLVFVPLHLGIGWIYVLVAPGRLPRIESASAEEAPANPFEAQGPGEGAEGRGGHAE
jgi:hypothetical protein